MRRAALFAAVAFAIVCAAARAQETAPGPEFAAFVKLAQHFTDVRFDVASRIRNASGDHDSVLRVVFRKPHFARCEVAAGDSAGGVAVWRGGSKVLVRPPGILSRFALALDRDDPHVVDSRGRGCGQTTLDNFASDYAAHGTLRETDGPTIDATPTADVVWTVAGTDPSGDTKRDLYIAKTTHLPVELKSYRRGDLVEDSHFRHIEIDTGVPFSAFDL